MSHLYENDILKVIKERGTSECEYSTYIGGHECKRNFRYAIVEKSAENEDSHIAHLCKRHIEEGWILSNAPVLDFHTAWKWLSAHPINESYDKMNVGLYDLDIMVVKTNKYGTIKTNPEKNTNTQVWLEFGPFANYLRGFEDLFPHVPEHLAWQRTHDPRLDCGGNTFEEAIIVLAALVRHYYGDYVHE